MKMNSAVLSVSMRTNVENNTVAIEWKVQAVGFGLRLWIVCFSSVLRVREINTNTIAMAENLTSLTLSQSFPCLTSYIPVSLPFHPNLMLISSSPALGTRSGTGGMERSAMRRCGVS